MIAITAEAYTRHSQQNLGTSIQPGKPKTNAKFKR